MIIYAILFALSIILLLNSDKSETPGYFITYL
jgi:hypothetical protein